MQILSFIIQVLYIFSQDKHWFLRIKGEHNTFLLRIICYCSSRLRLSFLFDILSLKLSDKLKHVYCRILKACHPTLIVQA